MLAATTLIVAASVPTILETDDYIRLHTAQASDTHIERRLNRTVLAYITPWNSQGTRMVDEYVDKIDMVSPVWYTILITPPSDGGTASGATYTLSGGPPSQSDERWLKRKLRPNSSLRIVPRFYLDGWAQTDYATLLSQPSKWHELADLIAAEVNHRGYHGAVFESAASHLLFEPIQALAAALKASADGKTLTVVLPPLRTEHSLGGNKVDRVQHSQNRMIVQSIPQLAEVVDFFSVMTYDMSSAGGRVSSIDGSHFPKDSPLRGAKKGSLRQPGPNTSPVWIEENIRLIEEATRTAARAKASKVKKSAADRAPATGEGSNEEVERLRDPSNPLLYDDFIVQEELIEDEVVPDSQEQEEVDELALIRGKLLMGMPMYGYRYPVFWIDKSTGQGVPVPPPSNPYEARELVSRSDPTSDTAVLPFLRGPGEPLTMDAVVAALTDHDGVIVDTNAPDGEGWFDYTETITHQTQQQNLGVKEGDQIYWRLYLPLSSTTAARVGAVSAEQELQPGVSLWELGQASPLLLQDL